MSSVRSLRRACRRCRPGWGWQRSRGRSSPPRFQIGVGTGSRHQPRPDPGRSAAIQLAYGRKLAESSNRRLMSVKRTSAFIAGGYVRADACRYVQGSDAQRDSFQFFNGSVVR
jgi:hypothetical protein